MIMIGYAVIVGFFSGLGAIALYYLIRFCNYLFFTVFKPNLPWLGPFTVPLIGALGGLLVGLIIYHLAREAEGHGIPEVIYAVARKKGIIRPRVVLVKALTSALTIGSGGSAGIEGPIAQIGAGIGSTLGQILNLSEHRTILLVACGAGAGIAATFNAPLAGTVFALEVILGGFTTEAFGLVVVASVTASLLARLVLGNSPALSVVPYQLVQPAELLLYMLLGVVAAGVSLFFEYLFNWTEDLFAQLSRIPKWSRPALGGILFGLIGILLPQTLGRGETVVNQILQGQLKIAWFVALLCLVKIVTTSLTLGSGGSGGVLFPGIFVGACLGGAFGITLHQLLPGVTAGGGAYALVGMGAVFAAMNQAPITAVLMLFEMTQDYRIILPLMLCCGIATLLARAISRESVNTIRLRQKGILLPHGRNVDMLPKVLISDVMSAPVLTVNQDDHLDQVVKLMRKTGHSGLPVIDPDGCMIGMITLGDIGKVHPESRVQTRVKAVMTRHPVTVTPDQTLDEVAQILAIRNIGRLPVVDQHDSGKILGMITRSDIVRAYHRRRSDYE